MNRGIIEPKGLESTLAVQGTEILEKKTEGHEGATIEGFVKTASGRPDLVLVPCPSDDPNDPLNWSAWKKNAAFLALCFATVLAGVVGPVVAPGQLLLVEDLHQPLSRIALTNGIIVLFIGVGSWFFAPLARKFGHRPSFLLAGLISFVSIIWAAAGNSFGSLLAARAFQGLGMGCYFNNVPEAVNDLFFVHQRGFRLSLWNVSLIGGINIGPLISAQIIQAQNWHFAFWWLGLASGLSLLATFFLVPECAYDRRDYYNDIKLKFRSSPDSYPRDLAEEEKGKPDPSVAPHTAVLPSAQVGVSSEQPMSYVKTLRMYTGIKTEVPLWQLIIRPAFHITSPIVIFGSIVFSVSFNLLPMLATAYAQIFSAPPYNFSTSAIGMIAGLPPLIGTLLGTFAAGPFSDWFAKYMSTRNGGIFEPEYRLINLIPFAFFGGMGCFGWALSTEAGDGWPVIAVFIAILHIGISAGTIGIIGYVSESAGLQAADAVGMVVFIKSCTGFGFTFFVNDWYAARGPKQFFVSLGCLILAVCALGIPMYIVGKVARYWSQRHALGRKQSVMS